MRLRRKHRLWPRLLALLVLSTGAALGPAYAAEFPLIRVETLAGEVLDLPKAFAAGPSVIILVYDQKQQADAGTWLPFLQGIGTGKPATRYYLIAALPAGLSLARGMVEGIMRSAARDPSQLDRTILLFTNVRHLQDSLGIKEASAIHVLVLDAAGQAVAAVSGPYRPLSARRIGDALASLGGSQVGDPADGQQEIEGVEQFP